jgi:hypothetical protein
MADNVWRMRVFELETALATAKVERERALDSRDLAVRQLDRARVERDEAREQRDNAIRLREDERRFADRMVEDKRTAEAELYEALHRLAHRSKHPDTEPQFIDLACYDALARYEREVGD